MQYIAAPPSYLKQIQFFLRGQSIRNCDELRKIFIDLNKFNEIESSE